jgi:pimeloyl-ACP methyl ester carboxylesterase
MLHVKRLEHSENQEWIVFIHGAGGSSSIWFKQVKDFSEHFNVLLIDLRGHGKSKNHTADKKYSFELLANDVLHTLETEKIPQAHFVGVSMGTIIIQQIALTNPEIVKSMIYSGAVTKLTFKSRILLRLGRILHPFIPYMGLYALFARIIMPRNNHKQSRLLFIREAQKLMSKEFNRWFKLTARLTSYLGKLEYHQISIPTLYIMGSEDHLFLPPVREIVQKNTATLLKIIENCGHVVNIEQPELFNQHSIDFILANR